MKTEIRAFIKAALDLCFPRCCLVCSLPLNYRDDELNVQICKTCVSRVQKVKSPFCHICGLSFANTAGEDHFCGSCLTKTHHFDKVRSLVFYEAPLATLLQSFKYHGDTTPLAFFIYLKEHHFKTLKLQTPDVITPVPLHPKRLRERGFNQAAVLTKSFFPTSRKNIELTSLQRTRYTAPQTGLSGKERRKNIRGAFKVVGDTFQDKKILLVDDVFTTGTTVDECAKVLKNAGAVAVEVLTLARADL